MSVDPVMEAVERGWVPDPLVRSGIRRQLRRKLAEERRGGAAAVAARRRERLGALHGPALALHTDEANRQHYEVPAEFFERVLGARLKYSCGLWTPGITTLDAAEEAMLALTAERAALADGQRILELGCGWGSLSLWTAERYPRATIVAVSNSHSQRRFIETRAAARGLRNLRVVTSDMNAFDPGATFDRVVSVEMFEHMRNWPELLERIAGWLGPDGRMFLQVFCHRELTWFFETDGRSDWIARHFFTGGLMPSADLVRACAGPLEVEAQWDVSGAHYARTCEAWLARLDAGPGDVLPVLARVHGTREARRAFARWRVFLMACAELFGHASGTEWHVTHARLAPRAPAAPAP